MISRKMQMFVSSGATIRAMFEEGKKMAAVYGADNVCDFSLGNPNLPAPEAVKNEIIRVLNEEDPVDVHGYMFNSGFPHVRDAVAESLNKRFGADFSRSNILMTVGAAGGLNVILNTFINPHDEIVVFAPYFGEYKSYAISFDAELTVIPPNIPDFQPDLEAFEQMLTPSTKLVIINSPNNPTGVVYSENTIIRLAEILNRKQKEFKTDIYLVSDEPYRELVYDGKEVPYITNYYDNSIVAYSYSKSLSLAGERIGYLVIPDTVSEFESVVYAANISTRILGFVNAPSLMQKAVAGCLDARVDVDFYNKNRQRLYGSLTDMGYECTYPEGAFYLWMKTPVESDKEFVDLAKKYQLLLVPGTYFGCPGYARIAYCVSPKTIETALPKFKLLMEEIRSAL
ncbi:pyridoxal phosphate-dependent aminotransferase [Bacillota bacterium]